MTEQIEYVKIPQYVDFNLKRDYLNIRNRFQKGYTSVSGEPGYFYFKILFDHIDSPLLRTSRKMEFSEKSGGVYIEKLHSISAERFLFANRGRSKCDQRLQSLLRFQELLWYLEHDAPWAFRGVSGLGEALYTDLAKPGDGNKQVKIQCSEEFVDFRLSLLMDLYRFTCYDYLNQRVIVPENLRRFNMSVLFFEVPIRWFQTPVKADTLANSVLEGVDSIGSLFGKQSKSTHPDWREVSYGTLSNSAKEVGLRESLSAKIIHLRDCEFDPKSMMSGFEKGDNQKPGSTLPTIGINFQRAFTQDISEWFEMNISELHQAFQSTYTQEIGDWVDPAGETVPSRRPDQTVMNEITVNGVKTDGTLKSFIQQSLDNISKDFASMSDAFASAFTAKQGTDRTARWEYIRTYKLGDTASSGGQGIFGSFARDIAKSTEQAIDNIMGSITSYLTLGNIYDNSWRSMMSGALSAGSASDASSSLIKSGFSWAAEKTGSKMMETIANGGVGAVIRQTGSGVAQSILGQGGSKQLSDLWSFQKAKHAQALKAGHDGNFTPASMAGHASVLTNDKDKDYSPPSLLGSAPVLSEFKDSRAALDALREIHLKDKYGTINLSLEDKEEHIKALAFTEISSLKFHSPVITDDDEDYILPSLSGSAPVLSEFKNTRKALDSLRKIHLKDKYGTINKMKDMFSMYFRDMQEHEKTFKDTSIVSLKPHTNTLIPELHEQDLKANQSASMTQAQSFTKLI